MLQNIINKSYIYTCLVKNVLLLEFYNQIIIYLEYNQEVSHTSWVAMQQAQVIIIQKPELQRIFKDFQAKVPQEQMEEAAIELGKESLAYRNIYYDIICSGIQWKITNNKLSHILYQSILNCYKQQAIIIAGSKNLRLIVPNFLELSFTNSQKRIKNINQHQQYIQKKMPYQLLFNPKEPKEPCKGTTCFQEIKMFNKNQKFLCQQNQVVQFSCSTIHMNQLNNQEKFSSTQIRQQQNKQDYSIRGGGNVDSQREIILSNNCLDNCQILLYCKMFDLLKIIKLNGFSENQQHNFSETNQTSFFTLDKLTDVQDKENKKQQSSDSSTIMSKQLIFRKLCLQIEQYSPTGSQIEMQEYQKNKWQKNNSLNFVLLEITMIVKSFLDFSFWQLNSTFNYFQFDETKIIIKALKMNTLTLFNFYLSFTQFHNRKSIQKEQEKGHRINNSEIFLIDLENFSQLLASNLTIHQITEIKYNENEQELQKPHNHKIVLTNDWKRLYFDDFSSNWRYTQLIRNCSLFKRNGSNYSFPHKSIQNFYVASYILNFFYQLQTQKKLRQFDQEEIYNQEEFNLSKDYFKGILPFLKYNLKQEVISKLIEVVKLSKKNSPQYMRAASNSLFLLSFAKQYLGNQQFQNIAISNTNIHGLSFYNSNLEGSEFNDVNISSCNFNGANLNNVKWKVNCNELSVFRFHSNHKPTVSFSPKTNILASGSQDNTILLWDVPTGKQLVLMKGHNCEVNNISFSHNGQNLASCSNDKTIRLWNIQVGKQVGLIIGCKRNIHSVIFLFNGKILTSGSSDSLLRIWNVQTKKQLAVVKGHKNNFYSQAIQPNGNIVASSGNENIIRLMDFTTRTQLCCLTGHSDLITSVSFSPNGKILASGSHDETIILWRVNTREQYALLKGHKGHVLSIAFSPDGLILASGSCDYTIRLWDVKMGKLQGILEGHTCFVCSVIFSSDSQILASASKDNTIRLWDRKIQKTTFENISNCVNQVAISSDGHIIAACSDDGTIQLRDKTGSLISKLQSQSGPVHSIAFSNDNKLLASDRSDNNIQLWDVKNGQKFSHLKGHTNKINSLAFSPESLILASGSDDTKIILWDIKSLKQLAILEGHDSGVLSVAFSPNGQRLASGSINKPFLLWEVNTRKQFVLQGEHKNEVLSIAFSPNGLILATGNGENTIQFWDLTELKQLTTLEGHTDKVVCVAFSPDSSLLASSSYNKTIRLWDVKSQQLLALLKGHTDYVCSVSFSPDSQILVSGSDDATIRLWDLTGRKQSKILCKQVIGNKYLFQSKNCSIIGAKIETIFLTNLMPLFRQIEAVDLHNMI